MIPKTNVRFWNTRMGAANMLDKKPELVVYAGPNGSGKSTLTRLARISGIYINADDIKAASHCDDLAAAKAAEALRENALSQKEPFTFETVLSTPRNLDLMRRARAQGYFIWGLYVLTADPNINLMRVRSREQNGGHGVPEEKITARYYRSLALLPSFIAVCDVCHVYDNTMEPTRIFKKRKDQSFVFPSGIWTEDKIRQLITASL